MKLKDGDLFNAKITKIKSSSVVDLRGSRKTRELKQKNLSLKCYTNSKMYAGFNL